MNVEILIHGVPQGQDYYGVEEERTYVETFYDNSAESVKFVVEPKKTGNNAFVYYTYLRYKGIVGSGGRPGSYFGLTLRIDKYYQDVIHVYNMLEMVFKKHVVGVLLSSSGESYKYMVSSFASKKSDLEQLQQGLIQLIQGTCNWSKFVDIDASFLHLNNTAALCNIADITENSMFAALKKYSRVTLSPDYKSNLAKEYEKRIQDAEGKGGSIVAEKDKKLAEKDSEINTLKSTVSTQKTRIDALQTENMQLKKNGNLTQMISGIKEPINSLADYFHIQDSQKKPQKPSYGFKNFILGIAGCVLSAIVIALLLFTKKPKDIDTKPLENQIAELTKINSQLTEEIGIKNNTITDLRTQLAQKPKEPQTPPSSIEKKNLRIDIEPYKEGESLDRDKTYTIKVKEKDGAKADYTGKGKWKITNADITNGSVTDAQIKIKPTGDGKVTLQFEADNCTCQERSFTVHSPSATPVISFNLKMVPDSDVVLLDNKYTIEVQGYEGEVEEWRYSGCSGDKKSGLTTEITIINDGKNKDAVITFVPKGMSVDEARKHQIRKPIKLN